jgi:Cu+-exporting ATPase
MAEGLATARPNRPLAVGQLPCSHCRQPVDPLRAARVACFDDRFFYFCCEDCRTAFVVPSAHVAAPPEVPLAARLAAAEPEDPEFAEVKARHRKALALSEIASDEELSHPGLAPVDAPPFVEPVPPPLSAAPTDMPGLMLGLAALAASLSAALALLGPALPVSAARWLLTTVGAGAAVAHTWTRSRDEASPHPVLLHCVPVGAVLTAAIALVTSYAELATTLQFASAVVVLTAVAIWWLGRSALPVETERNRIADALDLWSERVAGEGTMRVHASDLRPGEEVVVVAGDCVPADAQVVAGTASVEPWIDASEPVFRQEGDSVVGGARVLEGRLRLVVSWAGLDRSWLRLTWDPRRRADLFAWAPRVARLVVNRLAPLAGVLAILASYAATQDLISSLLIALCVQSVLGNPALAQLPSLHIAHGLLTALRRGVSFRTAAAFDRAGVISTATFCARGTLLLGEPEVASVEVVGPSGDAERVLALVAGTESSSSHPVGAAVLRAARDRGVRPDAVRSPNMIAGLGVTAVASSGQPLVVGSRGLMLRERISVAAAESRIIELEAHGRTVLLVAVAGRLAGLVALQDGLRPGARAAVHLLHDVGIEPVLVSGAARETCEALGRALDLDHIRPELLPAERGEEVRRLADGGATVAVVGRSPSDDAALAAADLSIALASAGSTSAEWDVQLASDDVRDAALALRIARQTRREALLSLALTLGPGIAGLIAVTLGAAPSLAAPIAAFAGAAAAHYRLRARTLAPV